MIFAKPHLADVIKVRIMNDTTNKYRGIVHCVSDILRYEGLFAFYKGFGMCWARVESFHVGEDK